MEEIVGFSINTMLLSGVLNKISKGISNNKILPYTSYITFRLRGNVLELTTSDSSNFYTHYINLNDEFEELKFSLKGEALIQLVSRSTSEYVEFEVDEKFVDVWSNGNYKFERIDEVIPVRDLILNMEPYIINSADLVKLTLAEAALGRLVVNQYLMGYYLKGRSIFTTNGVKLSQIDNFTETEFEGMLLTLDFVNLLQTCEGEIKLYNIAGTIVAQTNNSLIYGPEQNSKDQYPDVAAYITSLEESYPALGVLLFPKVILDALSRLSIFNAGHVYFQVKNNKISLTTDKKGKTIEEIFDADPDNTGTVGLVDCLIPVSLQQLSDLVSKHSGAILLKYVDENQPLILKGENLTQLIAPMEVE
jgi:hypothetical protein